MSVEDGDAPVDRARRGVRGWVRELGRRTGRGLGLVTPYGILAFLAASAVAPVAGAGLGASGVFAATLDQLGDVGGGYLSDVLARTAGRMRGRAVTEQQWRDAVAEELLSRLDAGDEQSEALRADVGRLLRAVDAVEVALSEAVRGDPGLRDELAAAFHLLGEDIGALRWMVTDVHRVLGDVRRQLAERSHEQRAEMERIRRQLITITYLTSRIDRDRADDPGGTAGTVEPTGTTGSGTDPHGLAPVCPYPGLASFEPEDAAWFHGREEQIAQVLGHLAEQAAGGPPLVVTGVSGVGKSSLLRAGVLPAVAGGALGESSGWPWILVTPGSDPLDELLARTVARAGVDPDEPGIETVRAEPTRFGELAAKAADAIAAKAADAIAADPADAIAAETADVIQQPAADTMVGPAAADRLVIVVDQFEELFTHCTDPAERLAYVTALTNAAPALVVIAVRADFYADCAELAPLARVLSAGHLVLGPLTIDQLRRAVRRPTERAGLDIDPGLVELLLADLGAANPAGYEPGALPLLGHALRATWVRRDGRRLTVDGYRATGGIHRAVAETAERIYLDLDQPGRRALRSALLTLVTVADTGTVLRRRGDRAAIEPGVLSRLVAARLVTAGEDTVEITHEALLTSWPRLTGWLAQARDELVLRQRFVVAAHDWQAADRDPDLLLRGTRLVAVREWSAGRDDLRPPETDYLHASVAAADAAEAARRSGVRRLRRLTVGLAVALLLAVAGGLVALDLQSTANEQRRQATSRQYAAESLIAAESDELLAMRKALDAWAQAPTIEAYGALVSAQSAVTLGPLGTEPGGLSVAVSPDGSVAAVGHPDGTVRLWEVATLRQRDVVLWHADRAAVVSLAFSPDGRFLASGSFAADGVQVWDVATGDLLRRLPAAGALGWLPGTTTVVASRVGADLTPELQVGGWDVTSGELVLALPTGMLAFDLSVSGDGRFLAIANPADGGGQVWRLADQVQVGAIPAVSQVAFGTAGTLVVGGSDGDLAVWTIGSAEPARPLTTGPQRPAAPLTMTPDGTLLTPGGWQPGRVDGWSIGADVVGPAYVGFAGQALMDLTVSADGRVVAVTGPDAPTMLFRRGASRLPHPESVRYLAVDPAGDRLATAAGDGALRIWDLPGRRTVATVRPDATVTGLAAAPDGTVAVATTDGRVLRYTADGTAGDALRIADGREETEGPDGPVTDARWPVYSPDGRQLAARVTRTGPDGTEQVGVAVWDLGARGPGGAAGEPDADPGAPVATFLPTGDGTVGALAFTPDGVRLLAAVNHTTVAGFDTETRAEIWSWRSTDLSPLDSQSVGAQRITALVVSPDGRLVAVAGTNRRVELRDVDGFRLLRATAPQTATVERITFSPDGTVLAGSLVADDLVRLWDTGSTQLTGVLSGHASDINTLAFTPDGVLLSGSTDTTLALWRLDAGQAVRMVCDVVGPAARTVGDHPPASCR
ncbi:AAA family ATPase [Solwaraspora sp. WMMD406]|uniref:NACHT and WD repeat domain-containing protein n=1 Tax=Solwaraspora sp. WMMD406 TaxID=3016095 RepID=UPI00241715BE|nr:AAA family ATPase [Solwaraspora sp. WMMD406]MDG4766953.1 AAA family ATPase [Solwaraspora sp. WMMD406]